MGTSGVRIVRYKNRYWVFTQDFDCYLEGQGEWLVKAIPESAEGYQKWLGDQKDFFQKWDNLLQKILCIEPSQLYHLESNETYDDIWGAAFDERLHMPPTYNPGTADDWIEYSYTYDLDLEIFSYDNSAHYRMDKIPRNGEWIRALYHDQRYHFVHPRCAPVESIGSLTMDNVEFSADAMEYWNALERKEVEAKLPSPSVLFRLRGQLFNIFQASQRKYLAVTLLGWTAKDLPFREVAYFIICLAAGGDHLQLVDERRIVEAHKVGLFAAVINGPEDGERELITSVGVGYHVKGLPIGSAPDGSRYWFEGVLVCLVPRLNQHNVQEKAIADAVYYGRIECARSSFNAILISIEQLVLLRSFPDGKVQHTCILPLINIEKHLSFDAEQRYGKEWVASFGIEEDDTDEEDSEESSHSSDDVENDPTENAMKSVSDLGEDCENSQDVIADPANDGAQSDLTAEHAQDQHSQGEQPDSSLAPEKKELGTSMDTFLKLVQFFEVNILEALRPYSGNGRGIPTEVISMILNNVSDLRTYHACQKVSKEFRALCHQRPLIMDDVLFLEPSEHHAEVVPEVEETIGYRRGIPLPTIDHVCLGMSQPFEILKAPQVDGNFCSVDLKSGSKTRVEIVEGQTEDQKSGYRIVTGSELNRKSFAASCPITIKGLDLASPWHRDVTSPVPWRDTANYYRAVGDRWGDAFGYHSITTDSKIEDLLMFWLQATEPLFRLAQNYTPKPEHFESHNYSLKSRQRLSFSNEDWLMPANTRQIWISTTEKDFQEYFHALYMRIKRSSMYWTMLWDDIIHETTVFLSGLDETFDMGMLKRYDKTRGDQVMGADDPLVLLVVGLEVRLFQWEQDSDSASEDQTRKASPFGKLVELKPGKSYMVDREIDRAVIEEFFGMVTAKLNSADRKEEADKSKTYFSTVRHYSSDEE